MSKYDVLTEWLESQKEDVIHTTFDELSEVVALPDCALRGRSCWANCHTQNASSFQKSWIKAGYEVTQIDMTSRIITFTKQSSASAATIPPAVVGIDPHMGIKTLKKESEDALFEQDVYQLLSENPKHTVSELVKSFNAEKDKEKTNIIKAVYKRFNEAKLKYSAKNKEIARITPALQDLVDENGLDYDCAKNIVLLTKKNSAIIESIIATDDSYYPFARELFKRFGKKAVKHNKNRALFAVIREIDRDNNTNVWRYKQSQACLYKLIDFILDPANDFWNRLKKGDKSLPDELVKTCGTEVRSLASKICKYLAEYLAPQSDAYYINDKFVRQVLPYYLDYYGVKHCIKSGSSLEGKNKYGEYSFSYANLFDLLEKLNKSRSEKHKDGEMTKSELDHILWYCYKSFKA